MKRIKKTKGEKRLHPLLILICVFFFLLVLFFVLVFAGKNETDKKKTATQTDAYKETERTEDTEDASEAAASDALFDETSYINVIEDVLAGGRLAVLPVTEDCIHMYENPFFAASAVTAIEACGDLCSFSDGTAAFSVTAEGNTAVYGVSFTVYEGKLNYLEVYEIPDGGDDLEE